MHRSATTPLDSHPLASHPLAADDCSGARGLLSAHLSGRDYEHLREAGYGVI